MYQDAGPGASVQSVDSGAPGSHVDPKNEEIARLTGIILNPNTPKQDREDAQKQLSQIGLKL